MENRTRTMSAAAFFAVIVTMLAGLLSGCGETTSAAPTSNTGQTTSAAPKGTIPINIQLWQPTNSTIKSAGKTVALVAYSDELKLRQKIDHVTFCLTDEVNFIIADTTTMPVQNGSVFGNIFAQPGTYALSANFYSKGGAILYEASARVVVNAGAISRVTLVIQNKPYVWLNARPTNVPGVYKPGQQYVMDFTSSNPSFATGDGGVSVDNDGQISCQVPINTAEFVNKTTIRITDHNTNQYSATFMFDLLSLVDELDTKGYIEIAWPPPGVIKIDAIFASDQGACYVMAPPASFSPQPTRGAANTAIAIVNIVSTCKKPVTISSMTTRVFDAAYLSNFIAMQNNGAFAISDTVTQATGETYYIDNQPHMSGVVTLKARTTLPSESILTVSLKSDITGNYPAHGQIQTLITDISAVDSDGNSVPFLQGQNMLVWLP